MNCSVCHYWNNGRGEKDCLRCKRYKDLQIKSIRRQSIKTEYLPDAVVENMEDPRVRDLMMIIKQLPGRYSTPIMQRSVLSMSLQEIALYHNLKRSTVLRRILKGYQIIQKSLRDG